MHGPILEKIQKFEWQFLYPPLYVFLYDSINLAIHMYNRDI